MGMLNLSHHHRGLMSMKKVFRHALYVQEGLKIPLVSERIGGGGVAACSIGTNIFTRSKRESHGIPCCQKKICKHPISTRGPEIFPLLPCGRQVISYELGAPICDPSVHGDHIHSWSVTCSLQRILLQKQNRSFSLSSQVGIRPSQCNQRGLRLSNGYPVQSSLGMFQSERVSNIHSQSNPLSPRYAPCDQMEFRNVPSSQE